MNIQSPARQACPTAVLVQRGHAARPPVPSVVDPPSNRRHPWKHPTFARSPS
ncbi:hypothetical protein APY03_6138 [Variovorax sp. WDL1]|nr:hypothetical protein APY03_6138 [Variovorax sp. WDL1]